MSLAEAKKHLREDGTDQDIIIDALIVAAREYAENRTHRALITQTWRAKMDAFPRGRDPIVLPLPPLVSVTSVSYIDPDGVSQTWATSEYVVDAPSHPRAMEGRIYPALDKEYPTTASRQDVVTVEYVAGYGIPAKVPEAIRSAIKLMVGNWYEHREATISGTIIQPVPMAVDALLGPYARLSIGVR